MQSDCDKPYTPRKVNFYFINAGTVDHFTMWWLTKWARERTDTLLFGSLTAPKASGDGGRMVCHSQGPARLVCGHGVFGTHRKHRMGGLFYFPKHDFTKIFFRHSSLLKKWNNWRAILSRKGQVLSWCICPSESGWPGHLWLSSAIKALDDLPTSILIAKHPVQLVAEGTWGQMGGIWDKFRPSGGVCLSLELSARSTSSGVHLDVSLGREQSQSPKLFPIKLSKKAVQGLQRLQTYACTRMHTHTHRTQRVGASLVEDF